jgi:hypothetical protein
MLMIGAFTAVTALAVMPTAGASPVKGADGDVGIQWCNGQDNGGEIRLFDPQGRLRAREWQVSGTCNGDGTYRGNVADTFLDGQCATARFRDAGVVSTQGIDCSADNGPVEYVFNDRNGDRSAQIQLCVDTVACTSWIEIRGY